MTFPLIDRGRGWPADLAYPGSEVYIHWREALTGWRAFGVQDGKLVSPWAVQQYAPALGRGRPFPLGRGWNKACSERCDRSGYHPRPVGCSCGWRVMQRLEDVQDYIASGPPLQVKHVTIGRVEFYGRVSAGRPCDDPHGTVRAEYVCLMELHQPSHEAWEAALPVLSSRARVGTRASRA